MDRLHALTLGDVLRELRRTWPLRTATVDGPVRLTFPELDDRVNRLADALTGAGVGTGDRVLWLGQNSFRVLELLLAAAKLDALFCPANWRQSSEELAFVLDDLDPAVVVWQAAEVGERAQEGRARAVGSDALWLQHDDPDGYEAFVASGVSTDPERDGDPAGAVLLMYTAAFSGRPSAAMLSHAGLIGQALVQAHLHDLGPETVYLNAGPLFHIATFMTTIAALVHGGTNVFLARVGADEVCRLITTERCTTAFLPGPVVTRIVELNADGHYDLSSLRTPPGKSAWNAMVSPDTSRGARHPAGYGQTEVTGVVTGNFAGEAMLGAHGRPLPLAQVRLVDPDGIDVPDGETGEIVCRGPLAMIGYWNRAEETARRRRGGWHHTGDLGRREPDGSITFVAPAGRLIKSAAENIYPTEVEASIATHPAVAECAVIGVPDREWTQRVVAIVALRDGETATADDIARHCQASVASYKKPHAVEFVDALPRTGFTIDYDALDTRFGGGGYPGTGAGADE